MALLVDKHSFVGEFQFQFQNDVQYWLDYIETAEKVFLVGLFGETLYLKLKTNPADADFDPIKAVFFYQGRECQGLVYAATAHVYSELIKFNGVINSGHATVIKGEATTDVDLRLNYTRARNNAIINARLIRMKLTEGVTGLENYKFVAQYRLSNYLW